eukprot:CAMPEP_0174716512 /NCGR_PEP_ID=MMETSP1094-20130205/24294_1 /TAXON_ID=156173 /ORGANISM="Chrysochromulina brevifilum, Strain UTEX LB 985" /LENGTH=214 /DNA_ID=CAMNT_0015916281 /DNA_START=15 /DNA_END=659 /DNA_ORIENTATION=+
MARLDPWVNPNPNDIEDPAGAAEDYANYQNAAVKPVDRLLGRLGTTKAQMRSASQLNWAGKGVSNSDCTLIAHVIKTSSAYTANPSISLLSLDNNMIGDDGLAQISEALKIRNGMLANVNCLWLNNNQFGDNGTAALADALKSGAMIGLKTLYLNDNQISDEGTFALADAIQNGIGALDHLRQIYLANNRITPAGADAINRAVAKRGRITVYFN